MKNVSASSPPKLKEKTTGESPIAKIIRFILIGLFDFGALWFIYNAYQLGFFQLAFVLGIITVMVNTIFLVKGLYPFRWLAIGLSFMILFVIYPIIFTIYVAFTNYGDGHLVTKQQALQIIDNIKYLPEEGKSYRWAGYRAEDGSYALWIVDVDGTGFLAKENEDLLAIAPGTEGVGELDANGFPVSIEGYNRLNAIVAASDQNLRNIKFGPEDLTLQVRSTNEAAELLPRYDFDPDLDALFDNQTGEIFYNIDGTFTSRTGKTVIPGFRAEIGFTNFIRFATSPSLRGPLVRIVAWNFVFPTISVLTTFSLGLAIALLFNDKDFPFKKIIRSFLLVPYTIPSLITILIWRGMMNPEIGVINRTLNATIGMAPPWFTDPTWAQAAVLLVNLWLGYPYFMLITSGALQSIPSDLYEAATVDGANAWAKFRNITLPLLLVAVGPLLIASYIFNFNNFNLIYLFIGGGPPIVGAETRAGHTDILISYVYALAFDTGGRGVQYGLASAITIFIFIIVGTLTLLQFRFTNMWEEVGENV